MRLHTHMQQVRRHWPEVHRMKTAGDLCRQAVHPWTCAVALSLSCMAGALPRRAQVHLLSGSGRTVYHGPPHAVVPYFASMLGYTFPPHENVADTLLDIVAGGARRGSPFLEGGELVRADTESDAKQNILRCDIYQLGTFLASPAQLTGKRYSEECTAAELPERWEAEGEDWAAQLPRYPGHGATASNGGFGDRAIAGVAAQQQQQQQQRRAMRRVIQSAGGAVGSGHAAQRADGGSGAGELPDPVSNSESDYDADMVAELADRVGSLAGAPGAGIGVRAGSIPEPGGREAGAVKQPQLTQEVKEIIEAEYDRLLRAAAAAAAAATSATDRHTRGGGLSAKSSGAVHGVVHGAAGVVAAAAAKLASRHSLRPRAASEGSAPAAGGTSAEVAATANVTGCVVNEQKALAPEGLNWSQLLQLFAALGQDGPDAEALVREIVWHAMEFPTTVPTPSGVSSGAYSQTHSSWAAVTPGGRPVAAHSSGGPGLSAPRASQAGPTSHPSAPHMPLMPGTFGPVLVRKQQLIRALQWVADGRMSAPDHPRQLPAAAMGVAAATGLMTNPLASVASNTLEVG